MALLGIGFFFLTDSEVVLLDGIFSLVGFAVVTTIDTIHEGGPLGHLVPFADPAVVILLVIASLPVPIGIIPTS